MSLSPSPQHQAHSVTSDCEEFLRSEDRFLNYEYAKLHDLIYIPSGLCAHFLKTDFVGCHCAVRYHYLVVNRKVAAAYSCQRIPLAVVFQS